MESFRDVIHAVGGPVGLAAIIGVSKKHAAQMNYRNSIPPQYWALLVSGAGNSQITDQLLVSLAARSRLCAPAQEPAE